MGRLARYCCRAVYAAHSACWMAAQVLPYIWFHESNVVALEFDMVACLVLDGDMIVDGEYYYYLDNVANTPPSEKYEQNASKVNYYSFIQNAHRARHFFLILGLMLFQKTVGLCSLNGIRSEEYTKNECMYKNPPK